MGSSSANWLLNGAKPNFVTGAGLVSTSLTWEQIQTWNLGADLAFLKNRLTATFDVYTRYTNNMVGPGVDLPAILGTAVPVTNNTNLKTNGFELQLNWGEHLSNGFSYNIRASIANSKSIVTKYPNPTGTLPAVGTLYPSTYYVGETLGDIWGYTTIGIAKTDQEMNDHLATLANGGQNALGSNWKAGDIMYADVNGDGKIDGGANTLNDHGDLKIIGNSAPKFPFSLDLSADWKGVDIRAFFQGILKRDWFSNSYYFWGACPWGIWWSTGLVQQENYFRGDANDPMGQNINSYYPRPLFDSKNQQVQTRYLLNAAYMRLKNLQLGYTLPQSFTEKAGIQKLRFYLSGENLLTFTKMPKMFDPETVDGGYTDNNGIAQGNVYPISKVFAVGLSVTF
jgi:hypothetical protein